MKMQNSVISVKKNFKNKFVKDKNYLKVRDHCHYRGEYRGATHSICNLKYNFPEKNPVAIHSVSNCDYHFIIKKLAEKFKELCTCLGQDTEKDIIFTVPIKRKSYKN